MAVKTIHRVNEDLLRRMRKLQAKECSVRVGVFGDAASKTEEGGKTVGFIAQVHEFGAPSVGIPERSFMRATAREQRKVITKEQAKLLDAFLSGKITIENALAVLGESLVSKIKRYIRAGIPPELSEARKRQKIRAGRPGNTPLIDTGQLINSIGYEVET